ncbi:uncharacterized protein IUM83_05491 [Phytophthora cinnamomi]|uniref:uncharacterized protein n=1 Tax=Phytophthora cinnamomi TaxID=4785 RepID=UPI003559E557|nr:hypothetical protein IUM83_05491 [Phytophthora cinnamomi]
MPRAAVRRHAQGAAILMLAQYCYESWDAEAIHALMASTNAVERPLIPDMRFNPDKCPDANALEDYRFTCSELKELVQLMLIPDVFITGKLSHVRKQFGRSDSSCCRIITDLYCFLDEEWKDTLFFNDRVYADNHTSRLSAVQASEGEGLLRCKVHSIGFPASVLQMAYAYHSMGRLRAACTTHLCTVKASCLPI